MDFVNRQFFLQLPAIQEHILIKTQVVSHAQLAAKPVRRGQNVKAVLFLVLHLQEPNVSLNVVMG